MDYKRVAARRQSALSWQRRNVLQSLFRQNAVSRPPLVRIYRDEEWVGASAIVMALPAVNSSVHVRNTHGAGTRIAHLAIGYALLLTAIWTTRPAQLWWSLAAAAWIVFSVVRLGRSAQELGLRFTNFRPSAWIITAAAVLACIASAIALVAGTFHPLFGLLPQIPHSLMYAFWALQQEFILQCFFFVELESLLGTRRAVVAAALLFSAAHLPNPVLTATTLLMALFFVAAFARYRNLYALALAHAILGLALAVTVPDDIHRHMRVGIGYLHYRSPSVHPAMTR